VDADPLPKVTPYLLRRADDMCARRLAASFTGTRGSDDPVNRARLRSAFLDAAAAVHADAGPPKLDRFVAPSHLVVEERAVFDQAADWYGRFFGDRPVHLHLHDCDEPTVSPRRGVRVGGWVDLTVVGDDGIRELRQLELWAGRPPAEDPLELEAVWVAVLRLARWVGDEPLRVSWTDLVRGVHRERTVAVAAVLPELSARFDERVGVVRTRAASADARAGNDCGACTTLWRCPAHPGAIDVRAPRSRRGTGAIGRPGVVRLSPTALETWGQCRRAWRNQYLLSLPASDDPGFGDHGRLLHDVLRFVHEHGSCADAAHVASVVEGHGGDDRLRDELARHARRCPAGAATPVGHELDLARFHREPWPPFMATARVDAVWLHDGVLDARDYKTGRVWYPALSEDPRAQLQAWVLAPRAAEQGSRLRLRYEYLSPDVEEDPPAWEPDREELRDVEERLRVVVEAMRDERDFRGVADAAVCAHCRYRSICPDRADGATPSRATAIWPAPDGALLDEPT